MRVFIHIFLTVLILFSCKKKEGLKEVPIGDVKLMVPDRCSVVNMEGTDSHVLNLLTEKGDTVHLEYGKKGVVNSLFDPMPVVFPKNQEQAIEKIAGSKPAADEVLFSDSPQEDMAQNIFDPSYYMYDTINGIVAKLVIPKRYGTGVTGIYTPELKSGYVFSAYATNLDSSSHSEVMRIFRTIHYK